MAIANLRQSCSKLRPRSSTVPTSLSDTCVRRGQSLKPRSNVLTWPCSSWNGRSARCGASREGRHHYLRGTHPRGDHRVHRAAAGPGLRMIRLFTKWGWPWELLLWLLVLELARVIGS